MLAISWSTRESAFGVSIKVGNMTIFIVECNETHAGSRLLTDTCGVLVLISAIKAFGARPCYEAAIILAKRIRLRDIPRIHSFGKICRLSIMGIVCMSLLTLLCGSTINAPPPADSTMMAKNFGFTAQNVESQLLLETPLKISSIGLI
uniref:Uncharacterized protein n=1 Tax=Glossina palpalis gambiensis TaxID=67801 RepID=A0A1B0AUZ6_9MUSC